MLRSRNPPASARLMREHSLAPRLVEVDDKFLRQRVPVSTFLARPDEGTIFVAFFANAACTSHTMWKRCKYLRRNLHDYVVRKMFVSSKNIYFKFQSG